MEGGGVTDSGASQGKPRRRVYGGRRYVHFVTFSCYKRRRLLDDPGARGIVLHHLARQAERQHAAVAGFVIMPDHVHALVRMAQPGTLSVFIGQWKRMASRGLRAHFREHMPSYAGRMEAVEPVWQPKFQSFEVFSRAKFLEKLEYIHNNPVRKGLVAKSAAWPYSSARRYLKGTPVGVEITPFS